MEPTSLPRAKSIYLISIQDLLSERNIRSEFDPREGSLHIDGDIKISCSFEKKKVIVYTLTYGSEEIKLSHLYGDKLVDTILVHYREMKLKKLLD